MTARRYYDEKTEKLIDTYKPFFKWAAKKYGTGEFPVFDASEKWFFDCVKGNKKLVLANGLNYFKNATVVIKNISLSCNGVKFTGKKGKAKHYKLTKPFIRKL